MTADPGSAPSSSPSSGPSTHERSPFLALARELQRRFREGRSAIGDAAWRRWRRRITLGVAGMLVLMIALRFLAEWALARGLLAWESAFLVWLGTGAPIRFSTAVFLQTPGSDPTLIILVGLAAGIAAWARRPIACVSIVLAAVVPDLVGRFGWLIWSRARPDLLYEGVASPGFHSFPSGHTSKTFAVYGILTLLWIRASGSRLEKAAAVALLAVVAVVVPLGRMAMGVHWPSDVLGGLVIGAAWLAVLATPDLGAPSVAGQRAAGTRL
jgi:membrane-associated phospholipid phosphatase